MGKTMECPDCGKTMKSGGLKLHRVRWCKVRKDQEKRYTAPEEEKGMVETVVNLVKSTKEEVVEFDLWNVITINGIDYVNTLILEDGREVRVSKPHRIGQTMYGEDGAFKITKSLMNNLLSLDSIANEAEKRIFDQKKIKLHYETEGVKKMSMKV